MQKNLNLVTDALETKIEQCSAIWGKPNLEFNGNTLPIAMALSVLKESLSSPAVTVLRSGSFGAFLVNDKKISGLTKALPLKRQNPKYTKSNYLHWTSSRTVAGDVYKRVKKLFRLDSRRFEERAIRALLLLYPLPSIRLSIILRWVGETIESRGVAPTAQQFKTKWNEMQLPLYMGTLVDRDVKECLERGNEPKYNVTSKLLTYFRAKKWTFVASNVNVTNCTFSLGGDCRSCEKLKTKYSFDLPKATEIDLIFTDGKKQIIVELKTTQAEKCSAYTKWNNTHQAQMTNYMYYLTYPTTLPYDYFIVTISLVNNKISIVRPKAPQHSKMIMSSEGFRSVCKKCLNKMFI